MIDDGGVAGAGAGDDGAGAGAGGADDGAAAGGGKGAAPKERLSFKGALDQVRAAMGATKGEGDPARAGAAAGDDGAGAGDDDGAGAAGDEGETAEQLDARLAAMDPAEREAEVARLDALAADDPLIVDLGPAREGEEPIRIAAADQQMADHIRALKNRAASHETSLAIRDEAQGYIAQADEMRYEVQLDPGGFLLKNLVDQNGIVRVDDAAHIARVMLTQPGVLAQVKDWVVALAAHPEALPQEARLANADRIERETKVAPMVKRMKFENDNARACVRAMYTATEKFAPAEWTQQQRDQLVRDVTRDLQDTQLSENVRVTNPARIQKMVEGRLTQFGVTLNGGKGGAGGAGAGRPGAKIPGRTGPSAQNLVATDAARRRAAGPGPGAGSPAADMPKPPKGTKLTGKGNVFDYVRSHLPALRRASQ